MAVSKEQLFNSQVLIGHIERSLKEQVEEEYQVIRQELMERLDRKKDFIISGIVLNIMKKVDFQSLKDQLVITVHTDSFAGLPLKK